MNELAWKRLLDKIRDHNVVPVLGPRLLVAADGKTSLQRIIAERLLSLHGIQMEADELPPFRELNVVVTRLKSEVRPEDLYADVHAAIREVTADDAAIPQSIRQLAQIADFQLFVTLTPDDLLARSLRRHRAVNEIVYSLNSSGDESRDLPRDWHERRGEAQLLYLFGKSKTGPMFAIHDEDVLEYAHSLMANKVEPPRGFLDQIHRRSLLLIGCNFPDWLSRFFLRLTSEKALSEKNRREWLIDDLQPEEPLTCFLRSFSKDTEILGQTSPQDFVSELHSRWMAMQCASAPQDSPSIAETVPRGTLFFISYSRGTDLPRAEALYQSLLRLGVKDSQVWFDRQAIEPGQDFGQRIFDGIGGCRYFLPLLSGQAIQREEAFVFKEWKAANKRLEGMNRDFIIPVIVDPDYEPERYKCPTTSTWSQLDFGHAPEGNPDDRTTARLKVLVRDGHAWLKSHGRVESW